MKKLTIVIIVIFFASGMQFFAQKKKKSLEEGQERMEFHTNGQKENIKSILSNYDSHSLTTYDAKAIHKAFRDAGLRSDQTIANVIREFGFDPDKLHDLDPPPEMEIDFKKTENNSIQLANQSDKQRNEFSVSSTAVKPDGSLMSEYTGDGRGISLPVKWKNFPTATKYFALSLWHIPHPYSEPTKVKSYWLIYNIPADVHYLPENVKNIGIDGYNDKNSTGYDPMRSKGPGIKKYNLTIYALSEKPTFSKEKVHRSDLLKAIKGITLDECTLKYTYERIMD